MRQLIAAIFLGLGFFLFEANGPLNEFYMTWYMELPANSKEGFPQRFEGPLQMLGLASWLLVFLVVSYFSPKLLNAIRHQIGHDLQMFYFHPQFYHEVAGFSHLYFHERIHEAVKGNLTDFLDDPQAHRTQIVKALYSLRSALNTGYRADDIRITLMRPLKNEEGNSDQLQIEYWANELRKTPISRKEGATLGMGEGFSGCAWQERIPQIGGKRNRLFIPDARYTKTSSGHDLVDSFCAIPIFDEGPSVDGRPLLGVLNIDATKKWYFPTGLRKQRSFCEALQPFLTVLILHLTWLDALDNGKSVNTNMNPS